MTQRPRQPAAAFPGQGLDPRDVAAVLDAHAGSPLVRALADRTGRARWADADLRDTRLAQPAVVVASVLAARACGRRWHAAVGHSLGELSAAVIAGAIDDLDALDLAVTRAHLGHQAQQRRPGQMLVVMRLTDEQTEWLRRAAVAEAGGVLEVAVVNGPGQTVLSGDVVTTEAALTIAARLGGVARPLPITGGYHTPLLFDAVQPFAEALRAVCRPTVVPLVSSTQARALEGVDDIVEALARSLVLPVRWERAVAATLALGADGLVDVGPGRTLANLAAHAPELRTTPAGDPG